MCKPQEQGCNTHTHVPVPGLRQKPLDPAVKSGWALRFSRAPRTGHLPGKEQPPAPLLTDTQLCRAASARFAVQTQSQWKASLPDWRSGLLCNHGWVCLSLVAAPASMWSSSTRGRAEHSWAARPLEKPRVPRPMAAPSLGMLGRDSVPPPLPQLPLILY